MAESLRDKLTIYEHEKLVFAGIEGTTLKELSEIGSLIKSHYPSMEVAPIQIEPQLKRDFLATFEHSPFMDITLDQLLPTKNSIVGYSLDKEKLIERMSDIAKLAEFAPYKTPTPIEVREWEVGFELLNKYTYSQSKFISKATSQPIEKVFGFLHHTNFLREYMSKSEKEAMKLAGEKYNVKAP